jgi:signal peptidase II
MTTTPELGDRPGVALLLRRFLVVGVLIALDLWSKAYVFEWLRSDGIELVRDGCGHARMHVLGENVQWFTFMLSENPGAAFGQFAGFPHALIGLRIVAVIALTVMIIRARLGNAWFNGALILVLSGALGNLYDNLMLEATGGHPYGKVRDFIDVYFVTWKSHFPTFNVADSCISVGAVILLIGSFVKTDGEKESAGEAEPESEVATTSSAVEPE